MQEIQTTGATASEPSRFQDGGIYIGKPKRTGGGGGEGVLKCQLFCGLAGMLLR